MNKVLSRSLLYSNKTSFLIWVQTVYRQRVNQLDLPVYVFWENKKISEYKPLLLIRMYTVYDPHKNISHTNSQKK